uniref:HD domain-containing protein n=1 Tax=viral metagenome TaxID=1070528 RepID=A0A6C0EER9_9ZZZZ
MEFCVEFLNSITTGVDIDKNLSQLKSLCDNNPYTCYSAVCDLTKDDKQVLCDLYSTIGKILLVDFDIMISNGEVQEMKRTNLCNMLIHISKDNYHQNMKKGGKNYSCTYHKESLIEHLLMTSFVNATYAILYNALHPEPLLCILTGLLHDIGKVETMTYSMIETECFLSYPFHGELGAGILAQIYNSDFEQYISKDDWDNMCRTIAIHMCSYHELKNDDFNTRFKWNVAKIENHSVKQLLYNLSYGDHYGAFKEDFEPMLFNRSRYDYFKEITKPFDAQEFMKNNDKQTIVIFVRGMSGAGKTTVVNRIIELLKDNCISHTHVERDQVICCVAAQHEGMPMSCHRPIGEEYAKLRDIYEKEKLGEHVKNEFVRRIEEAIAKKHVVIIDTVMSYFKDISTSVPQSIKNCFIVSIDVVRNELFTEQDAERHGITLSKQINLHSKRTELSWLSEKVIKNAKDITSRCTSKEIGQSKTITKPYLCYVVGWNKTNSIGYGIMLNGIREITAHLKTETIEVAIDTNNMNIVEFYNHMYKLNGFEKTNEWFLDNKFMCNTISQFKGSEYENRFVMIAYFEMNTDWSKKWARECRGVILYRTNTDIWIPCKYHLQRGAESLTGQHVKHGISTTQDMDAKHLEIFDPIQKDTMMKLLSPIGVEIDMSLSFKVDGSLLGVTIYRGEMGKLFDSLIDNYGDDFAKTVKRMCKKIHPDLTMVLSTQKTLFVNEQMHDYVVTALCDFPDNPTKKPHEIFEEYGDGVLRNFYQLFNLTYKEINIITISCEIVCKNRLTKWKNLHMELTVSYDRSFFTVLGIACCHPNQIVWQPHFRHSYDIYLCNMLEPLYWFVENTKTIENMLSDLTLVIRSKMTKEEYLDKYKPHNSYFTSGEFDYEGFVGLRHKHNYDYCKIKTEEYYNSHKFRQSNIPYLIELGKTSSDIFPLCRIVTDFYKNLHGSLEKIMLAFIEILDREENILYVRIPDKAKKSYEKQNRMVRHKMLLNTSSSFPDVSFEIFSKEFESLKTSETDIDIIIGTFKAIIMKLEPWSDNYKDKIENMIRDNDDSLQNLFSHCYQSV